MTDYTRILNKASRNLSINGDLLEFFNSITAARLREIADFTSRELPGLHTAIASDPNDSELIAARGQLVADLGAALQILDYIGADYADSD